MATPTARFLRPVPQSSRPASSDADSPPRAIPASVHRVPAPDRVDGASQWDRRPSEAGRREPSWLTDLTDQITRSVNAIERVAEHVSTMRDDNTHLRTVTADLREALEAERLESGRRLAEQGRSMSQQKRRAAEAERSADSLAGMLCDLERQLTSRRASEQFADADEQFRRAG